MIVDSTATADVRFLHGLPLGRRAVFTHDGEVWMAYPLSKMARYGSHTSRLFGKALAAQQLLIEVITKRPDLYPVLARTLQVLDSVEHIPGWAHDRSDEKKNPPTMHWRKQVREWARERGATHATIRGCGDEKRLTVESCIARIRTARGPLAALSVAADGDQVRVTCEGRTVAVLDTPMRRDPDSGDYSPAEGAL